MTIAAAHLAAIDRLPAAPGHCQRCGRKLVCVILTTDPRWATSADPMPPHFGCPRHDVVLGARVDAMERIYTAALRDPADPHWAWAHGDVRGPIARAGVAAHDGLPARVTLYDGRVWVGDARCMVATTETAVEAVYDRMGGATPAQRRWAADAATRLEAWFWNGGCEARSLDAPRPVAGGDGEAVELGGFAVPHAYLDAQLVELVATLHPEAMWSVSAPLEPVLAWHHDGPVWCSPLAVVMPLRWQDEQAQEVAAA